MTKDDLHLLAEAIVVTREEITALQNATAVFQQQVDNIGRRVEQQDAQIAELRAAFKREIACLLEDLLAGKHGK